jgi:hypothetical protein
MHSVLGRDQVAKYIEHVGLGPLEQRVKLGGTVSLEDGGHAAAELCLVGSGVFVVGARSPTLGTATKLTDTPNVQLEGGRLRTDLTIDGRAHAIPRGKRRKAERLLALGRLRVEASPRHLAPLSGVLVEPPNEIEAAWLAGALAPGEVVLAWLHTASARATPSWLVGTASAPVRLLLTVRRLQAVAISRFGDTTVVELDPDRLRLEETRGRVRITDGQQVVSSPRAKSATFRRLVGAASLRGAERVLEVARLAWTAGEPDARAGAADLIEMAGRHGNPLARFAGFLVAHELASPERTMDLGSGLDALSQEGRPADALVTLHRDWAFGVASGQALVAALRALPGAGEPWALELHLSLHDAASGKNGDPLQAAALDIDLAEHLLEVNERQRAVQVLESRLHRLPRETLAEVLPPHDADLTRGAGGQTLRIRIFELLSTARGDGSTPDVHAVTELARLHPLVPERMRGLASLADDDLRRRACAVLALLDPTAPGVDEPLPPLQDSVRPLSDKLINEVLRHPASRADSPLLSRLQELLAAAPKPDVGMLRDYCEELNGDTHPEAVTALREASRALGTRVRAYVSRGAKGVGLRAYENDTAFILIGGQHLSDGDFRMSRAELQFAIGAELAHLRFGHVRVTSNDVWAGALEKGQQGLDMALSVLPILRGWRLADKAVKVTSKVPIPIVRRVIDATGGLKSSLIGRSVRPASGENEDVISTLNEHLVVAHRVMQLSADRAGLVLAQDVRPALRAMLLIRHDYRAEIPSMERKGLATVLGVRAEDGHMAYQDLAVRIAALLSFYLSDEFVRLRAALYD